jgi:hypothetical protein
MISYDDLLSITAGADLMIAGELIFAAPLVAESLGCAGFRRFSSLAHFSRLTIRPFWSMCHGLFTCEERDGRFIEPR